MQRTQGDNLLATCCLTPTDGVARDALIDWLIDDGDAFLVEALRSKDAEKYTRRSLDISLNLQQKVSLRHLFAAVAWEKSLRLITYTPPAPSVSEEDLAAMRETVSRYLPRGVPMSPWVSGPRSIRFGEQSRLDAPTDDRLDQLRQRADRGEELFPYGEDEEQG